MLFLHFLFAIAFSKNNISLTILYEKQVENTVGETYRIYLDQLIKTINELSKETNFKFDLLNVFAHNEYSKIPIYDKISVYAGSNEIDKRKEAIDEITDENIILAISSTLEKDLDEYAEINTEKIAYMINLDSDSNMNSDLLTTLHRSLLHVLSTLFGFEVPNLLDKKNTEERILFMKNIKNLEKKSSDADLEKKTKDENREKEANNKSIKNNLLETDAIVNQFDKIMNLLKYKDNDGGDNQSNTKKQDNNEQNPEKKIENSTENRTEIRNSKDTTTNQINKPYVPTENSKNEDLSLKETLKEVVSELRNLRYDITDSQFRRGDVQTKTYERDRNINRRSFSAPYRRFEDYTNESINGLSINDKNVKEYTPFNFKDKKITTSDLKLIDTKK